MKKIILTLIISAFVLQLSAQSNWITLNFTSYLSSGDHKEYLKKANSVLTELRGDEEKKAFQVVELYKTLSKVENKQIPLCYFSIAKSAVNLPIISSELIAKDVYFVTFKIGNKYYYCIQNFSKDKMVHVKLFYSHYSPSGEYSTSHLEGGAKNDNMSCISILPDYKSFKATEIEFTNSYFSSPCR